MILLLCLLLLSLLLYSGGIHVNIHLGKPHSEARRELTNLVPMGKILMRRTDDLKPHQSSGAQ